MKNIYAVLAMSVFILMTGSAHAESLVEKDYDGKASPVTTPWLEYYSPENKKADLDYVLAMRPHHAGALTMSDTYLANPERSSQRLQTLARAIKHNQEFEILMLDTVRGHVEAIHFNNSGKGWHQIATKKLAMRHRFMRLPIPTIHPVLNPRETVSAQDVLFAKAMIVHHDGALMMARDYLANPDAKNGYLERMNLDILRDQSQEIELMWDIVNRYDGNVCDLKITADMIDGMEDMMDHMDFSHVNCTMKENSNSHHHSH